MRARISLCLVLLFAGNLESQSAPSQRLKCNPKIVKPVSQSAALHAKAGTSLEGYKRSPLITFEMDEAGEVRSAKIKHTSGSSAVDEMALNSVRHWKFKPLPGCGTVNSEASLTIDFSAN